MEDHQNHEVATLGARQHPPFHRLRKSWNLRRHLQAQFSLNPSPPQFVNFHRRISANVTSFVFHRSDHFTQSRPTRSPPPALDRMILVIKSHQNQVEPSLFSACTVSKIAKRVFLKGFRECTKHHYLLIDFQQGFRQKHGCGNQLRRVAEYDSQNLNLGRHITALFLDIQQAFNRVWHDGLVANLSLSQRWWELHRNSNSTTRSQGRRQSNTCGGLWQKDVLM